MAIVCVSTLFFFGISSLVFYALMVLIFLHLMCLMLKEGCDGFYPCPVFRRKKCYGIKINHKTCVFLCKPYTVWLDVQTEGPLSLPYHARAAVLCCKFQLKTKILAAR